MNSVAVSSGANPPFWRLTAQLSLLSIIALFAFVYFYYMPASGLHFRVNDDYLIVKNAFQFSEGTRDVTEAIRRHTQAEAATRFRPLWHVFYYGQTKIIGANAEAWYLVSLIWGAITALCLFLAAIRIRSVPLVALGFGLFTLAGDQFQIYVRTAPAEKVGLAIFAIAMLLCVSDVEKRNMLTRVLLLVAAAMLATVKESFLMCIPSLCVFFFVVHYSSGSTRKFSAAVKIYWPMILFLLMIFLAGLTWILVFVNNAKLALSPLEHLVAAGVAFKVLCVQNPSALAILLFPLAYWRRADDRSFLIASVVFTAVLIAPQLYLYAKSGLSGRYLVPASLGLQFLAFSVLVCLWRPSWLAKYPIVAFLIWTGVAEARASNREISTWMNLSIKQQYIYGHVASNATGADKILIVEDPGYGHEVLLSSDVYLDKLHALPNIRFALYPRSDYNTSRWPYDYLAEINLRRYADRLLENSSDDADIDSFKVIVIYGMKDDFFGDYSVNLENYDVHAKYGVEILARKRGLADDE